METRDSDSVHLRWIEESGFADWSGKRVLDLGTGSGFICHQAMVNGASAAVGIDIVPPSSYQPETSSWKYLNIDLEDPKWSRLLLDSIGGKKFDVICAFDIIEHLTSPWLFATNCHQLLNQGGTFFVTTPNTNSWERLMKPDHWSGATDVQHKTLFNRYSLSFLLKKIDFTLISLKAPMRALSFLGKLNPQIGGQTFCWAEKRR